MSEEIKVILAADLTFARPNRLSPRYIPKGIRKLNQYAQDLGADGTRFMANRISISGWQLYWGPTDKSQLATLQQGDIYQSFRTEPPLLTHPIQSSQEIRHWQQKNNRTFPYPVLIPYRNMDAELPWLSRLRKRAPDIPITWQYANYTAKYLRAQHTNSDVDHVQITKEVAAGLPLKNLGLSYHIPTTSTLEATHEIAYLLDASKDLITKAELTFGRTDIGQDPQKEIAEIRKYIEGAECTHSRQLRRIIVKKGNIRTIVVGVPIPILAQAIGSNNPADLERELSTIITRTKQIARHRV